MARMCEVCGKKPSTGHSVSHANNKTKRRWLPNLQTVKTISGGTIKRVVVCATCIRSNRIVKAPHNPAKPKVAMA